MDAVSAASATEIPVAAPSTAGYLRVTSLAFWGVHVAAVVGVIALGWSWSGVALALALYFVRMFVVTAAYHRYFSHRTFKTSRGVPVPARARRAERGPEGRAVVGGPPPPAPQVLGHAERHPLGEAARVLVLAHRLDHGHASWDETDRRAWSRTWRSSPSCAALDRPSCTCCPRVALALAFLFAGRLARARLGLLRLDRAALARHVHDQLAGARVRQAPLRDHATTRATTGCSRCSRSARAGTTTTTTTRARPTRASAGGRST